ncbi:MAG: hypothetical protein SF053_11255 [Bacteroidia bacterium]|nr:hypothetical protein [Bacteroidia bacterium]
MKNQLLILAILLSATGLSACKWVSSENNPFIQPEKYMNTNVFPTPEATAQAGLEALSLLITAENAASFGFDTPDQARTAALTSPAAVYEIGFEKLTSAQTGDRLEKLASPSSEQIFPLAISDTYRSAVRISGRTNEYHLAGVGEAGYAEMLEKAREQARIQFGDSVKVSPETATFYSVPGIGATFIGIRVQETLWLLPSRDTRLSRTEERLFLPADRLLPILAEEARRMAELIKGERRLR